MSLTSSSLGSSLFSPEFSSSLSGGGSLFASASGSNFLPRFMVFFDGMYYCDVDGSYHLILQGEKKMAKNDQSRIQAFLAERVRAKDVEAKKKRSLRKD